MHVYQPFPVSECGQKPSALPWQFHKRLKENPLSAGNGAFSMAWRGRSDIWTLAVLFRNSNTKIIAKMGENRGFWCFFDRMIKIRPLFFVML
jgi:hypothetical protein